VLPVTEGRLWGGRFIHSLDAPDEAAWALGRSVSFDVRLWPHDLAGSKAHAEELLRIGVLTPGQHKEIVEALDEIAGEFADGSFQVFSHDEDLHSCIERRLLELCGETGGRLRAGRSRNDQIASDLRLYLRDALVRLIHGVRSVQQALATQAERTLDWLICGYTHLQRAQPVTLAHHLLAHAWALDRDAGRLADARARMDASTLGAGALASTTLPLDPAAYARQLGFARPAENSIDAVADRDFAVEFLAAAAMLGVHLSRLCEEVVLWTTTEFGWARLGEAFSTGSSIMPQKRNPDVAELVRGKTGRLVGDLVTLLVTLKGLPLAYNRDLQEDKEPVFDAVDTLEVALPAVAGMLASLQFDRERLTAAATDPLALATDLAEALVKAGVAFRSAHERVGRLVADAERRGCGLDELIREVGRVSLPELDDPVALLDPALAVKRRALTLGPAPDRVRAQLVSLRKRIETNSR
jgi:argininosuccinate lyase